MKIVIVILGVIMLSACTSTPSHNSSNSEDARQQLTAHLIANARCGLAELDKIETPDKPS